MGQETLMELELEDRDGEIVFGWRDPDGEDHFLYTDDRDGTYKVVRDS